jgi:hypothetical protein
MDGQNIAATFNGFTKPIASFAPLKTLRNSVNNRLPGAGLDFGIDATIGQNDDAMF